MIRCAICGEEIPEGSRRRKYCSDVCADAAYNKYHIEYYHKKSKTQQLRHEEEKRKKEKELKKKAFQKAISEMKVAVQTGQISLEDIHAKTGDIDKLPEIDFIPGIGSFVGTEPEWKITARINRLMKKVKKEMAEEIKKKAQERKKEMEAVRKGLGGTGRGITIWMNAYYLIEIRDAIKELTATVDRSTKSLEKAAKSLEKASKKLE